jgi:hypothetical protein
MPKMKRLHFDEAKVNNRFRKLILDPRSRSIAEHVAQVLIGTDIDGPDARLLIIEAAMTSELVRTPYQAAAVADGWEGRTDQWNRAANYIRVCRNAGRQLAFLVGVLR